MLTKLAISNYALIQDVEIQFQPGMNVITGETGAGKSILLGALGLILGKRADTGVLRDSQKRCIVEASFEIGQYQLQDFFEQQDLDYDHLLVIRRDISSTGKSRSFVNDIPVNLAVLNALGSKLFEIHSQHDNLLLFQKSFQFQSLDAFGKTLPEVASYNESYGQYILLEKTLNEMRAESAEAAKELEYHQFLFDELAAIRLESINEVALESELFALTNAEVLMAALAEADAMMQAGEIGVIDQMALVKKKLAHTNVSKLNELVERISASLEELRDIARDIELSREIAVPDPERLATLEGLFNTLNQLKSKHQAQSVEQLIAIKNDLDEKLLKTNNLSSAIAKQEKAAIETLKLATSLAKKLSENRKKAIPSFEKSLNELLGYVGMEYSKIRFHLQTLDTLGLYGFDDLNLELSSDKGLNFQNIKKTASGGELARINISIKEIITELLNLPTSIFDEIDTGVSGEIARKVGLLMQKMARNQQIITITHLPQIASLGKNHLFVYKKEMDGVVSTKVRQLTSEERVRAIAQMLSGDSVSSHALEQSRELLGYSN